MKYKKYITSAVLALGIITVGWVFSYLNTGSLYIQYQYLWDYRRLHPDIIPPTTTHRILAVGHDTTYADVMWLRLIQFVGDNIGNGRFLDFTHKILSQVQELHPRFARAYELDLLLLPTVSPENTTSEWERRREILRAGIGDYDERIGRICDMRKVAQISELWFWDELWNREDLRNPCISGDILYYIAARYDTDLLDRKKAVYYYKIASMHDDAPVATKFLWVLAYSSDGNYRDGALTFALMATSGYDNDNHTCQIFSEEIVTHLANKTPWTWEWIDSIYQKSQALTAPPYDPLKWTSCYESIERSLKQIYLGYIDELTRDKPDITKGDDLISSGLLPYIPTIRSQIWYTVTKTTGIWKFRENIDK